MRVGIKYCGGCNPHIDRRLLTRRLTHKLGFQIEFFNFDECVAVVVINGCGVGCAEAPSGKNAIVVCAEELDGQPCFEEALPEKIVEKILRLID